MSSEDHELELEEQVRGKTRTQTGEWAICSFLVFLSAVLVILLVGVFEEPPEGVARKLELGSTLKTVFTFDRTADFPVDIAVIILLISIMSSFCSLISLVADKSNSRTWLMRLMTLGPILPIFFSVVMVMLIASNYNKKSIIQDIIGTTEVTEVVETAD